MLLTSINYWSYPGGLAGTLPILEFLRQAKKHGYQAVELCIGDGGALTHRATEEDCKRILTQAAEVGIAVASVASGVYWSYNLSSHRDADRKQAKDVLERMVQITHWLGCKTLLTIPGAVDVFFNPNAPVRDYREVTELAREGLAAIVPAAQKAGVVMAIENVWNKFLLSPTEMAAFIDGFGSQAVGAYVDVANVLPYGYPDQWLRILGHRVAGVHFKDFRRAVGTVEGFVGLLEGDVDWPEVMAALDDIGYKGPVVGELLPTYRHFPEVKCELARIAMDHILKCR